MSVRTPAARASPHPAAGWLKPARHAIAGLASLGLLAAACSSQSASTPANDPSQTDAGIAPPPANAQCTVPPGVSSAPSSIAQVTDLLNALPKPVSVACFVATLARPLALQAADSEFSAQPAQSERSPRVFIFFPGLTMSVVAEGPGAHLLELGETRGAAVSLKAELEFPIAAELDADAPFRRLYFSDAITTCGFCHQGEVRAEDVASPLAFVSPAIRPLPNQRVALDDLRAEHANCDPEAEPERCALLSALFGPEPQPIDHEFPSAYRTFL